MEKKGVIPEDLKRDSIVVALVGQPNVGKSTIYNQLTGALQHVGNWPGKTVEVAWSKVRFGDHNIILVDLPGTYTLSGFTEEEEVAVDFILNEKPDVVVVITDVSALPRNLYLLLQVLELTNRVVLVVNMLDEADRWGVKIDFDKLRRVFGIPIIGTIAIRGVGLDEILSVAIRVAKNPPSPRRIRYERIEGYISEIEEKVVGMVPGLDPRYVAIRIVEGDEKILSMLPDHVKVNVNAILERMKFEFRRDPRLIIAAERYKIIDMILLETFSKKRIVDKLTERLDRIFFTRGLDMLLSFMILFVSFFVAYQVGYVFVDLLDMLLSDYVLAWISGVLANRVPVWSHSLLVDGIIGGVFFALVFLPLVFIFTFTLSFIENLGVLARISLAIDRVFSKFDASGKSLFPLMMGFACNVVSVTSSRIVLSHKEKLRVMIVSQFIQCPPRQVVIALLVGLILPPLLASIVFGLYIIFGFILAMLMFRVLKIFEGPAREEAPIELPPYRIPSLRVLLKISWSRTIIFVRRAGLYIVMANIIFWILFNIPPGATMENSLLGQIGGVIAIIIAPLGLGWREAIALVAGLVAKEITLGTLEFLYGDVGAIVNAISLPSLIAFITIYAYYMPCIATISTIKSESGSWKHTAKAILVSVSISLLLGYAVFSILSLVG